MVEKLPFSGQRPRTRRAREEQQLSRQRGLDQKYDNPTELNNSKKNFLFKNLFPTFFFFFFFKKRKTSQKSIFVFLFFS